MRRSWGQPPQPAPGAEEGAAGALAQGAPDGAWLLDARLERLPEVEEAAGRQT